MGCSFRVWISSRYRVSFGLLSSRRTRLGQISEWKRPTRKKFRLEIGDNRGILCQSLNLVVPLSIPQKIGKNFGSWIELKILVKLFKAQGRIKNSYEATPQKILKKTVEKSVPLNAFSKTSTSAPFELFNIATTCALNKSCQLWNVAIHTRHFVK